MRAADARPCAGARGWLSVLLPALLALAGVATAADPAAAAIGEVAQPRLEVIATTGGGAEAHHSGEPEIGAWEAAATVRRLVVYAGSLLAAGGVVFLAFVHDRRPDELGPLVRIVTAAAFVAAVATVAGLPLQSVAIAGDAGGLTDPTMLSLALDSTFGSALLVRLAGLAALLLGLARIRTTGGMGVAVAGAALTLGSFVLTGHTAISEPRWLVVGSNVAHTTAGAVWFGGLALLAIVLRRRRDITDPADGATMVARFSGIATVALLAVFAAGLALTWVEVRRPQALVASAYGWTLVAKVSLVAVIAAIGGYNKRWLLPAILRTRDAAEGGGQQAWRRLTHTVRFETYGIVAVLALTAVLVNLVPARNVVLAAEPFAEYAELRADEQVHLVVEPGQAGQNTVHVYLLDADGQPAALAEEVVLRFELPDAAVAALERTPRSAGPGHYVHTGPELSTSGTWSVTAVVGIDDFDRQTASFAVPIDG